MDARKGFGGHGKAGGPYYSTEEADAIRQKEKEDLENLIAGQSTDAEDEVSAVDEPAQDTQVRFGGTTTLGRIPSSGTRGAPLLVEDSLRDTLVSTTRASRTGPKKNPRSPILYGLLDVAGKRWVLQDWSTAQDYVTNKGFHYHHVFDSKDEANGWKNFVNAQTSNLKAPPPGTNRAKKVIVVDDSSSDSSDNPEVISKKNGRRSRKNSKHHQRRRPREGGSSSSSSESDPSSQDSDDSSSAASSSSSSSSGSGRRNKKHHSSRHGRRRSKNQGKTRVGHRTRRHSK
jgi:membrane peptidoglycan carboxypeptidase